MPIYVSIDTGRGIDDRILPRLFTKFATSSSQGVGLELYISKNIIESNWGRIWVRIILIERALHLHLVFHP
jgi:signal transduction histidine kinase